MLPSWRCLVNTSTTPGFVGEMGDHHCLCLPQTNNMLESHKRTWNSLVGHSANVWHIQELFIKQDAEVRRAYLSNAVGQAMTTNTRRNRGP